MAISYTVPGGSLEAPVEANPTLLFEKFHGYVVSEDGNRQDEKAGVDFLSVIADATQSAFGQHYRQWHDATSAVYERLPGLSWSEPYATLWRLVAGYANNPAWESGLVLHRLWGFPYVPGSTVRGALRQVAERELFDRLSELASEAATEWALDAPSDRLLAAVRQARVVRYIFGSFAWVDDEHDEPIVVRQVLEPWRVDLASTLAARFGENVPPVWSAVADDLARLTADDGPGGVLRCFDAVPAPDTEGPVVEPDVLTCHYPTYYAGSRSEAYDDEEQSPVPVPFLTVPPGVTFEFRFALHRSVSPADDDATEASRLLAELGGEDEPRAHVSDWLKRVVEEFGLGAKTAAGYGYFGPAMALVEPRERVVIPREDKPNQEAAKFLARYGSDILAHKAAAFELTQEARSAMAREYLHGEAWREIRERLETKETEKARGFLAKLKGWAEP